MKIHYLILFTVLLMTSAQSLSAAEWPAPFRANYEIYAGFVKAGEAVKQLKKLDSQRYEYTSESRTKGMMAFLIKDDIVEKSQLTLHQGLPRPLAHQHNRKGRKAKQVSQNYDWDQPSVNSTVNGTLHTFPPEPDAIDQGAYQLALMMRLAKSERNFTLPVAEHKRMEYYPIKHIKNTRLKTELGKLDTIMIHSEYKKQSTTLWCAPQYQYLPVKIEHREGGVTYTAYLIDFQRL